MAVVVVTAISQAVAIAVGVTVVLAFIGGLVGWELKNWLARQLAPIVQRQQEIAADVSAIKREVLPNGGTSLADRVVRIEATLQERERNG